MKNGFVELTNDPEIVAYIKISFYFILLYLVDILS